MYRILIFLIVLKSGLGQRKAKDIHGTLVNHEWGIKPEVVGGHKTRDNEFPHMAALGFGNQRERQWLCGGSLISDQFVLTAAHCTFLRNVGPVKLVRLGTINLTPTNERNYKDVPVAQIIRHPNYRPPSSYNDIALLRLQQKVMYSSNILPAYITSASNVNLARNTLTALGWGKTDFAGPTSNDLLKVGLRVVPNRECNRSYSRVSRKKLPQGIKEEIQLCAGGELQKDTCQGDSGGPLEHNVGGFHDIIGITSFGKACGISQSPGVYTRVSAFVPWIQSVAGH